jgi:hypothetical protein
MTGTKMRGIEGGFASSCGWLLLVNSRVAREHVVRLHNDHSIRAWIIGSRKANRMASIIANKRKYNYKHRPAVFYSMHY